MALYAHLPRALHHASLSFISVRSFISACRGQRGGVAVGTEGAEEGYRRGKAGGAGRLPR